jgi:hypothetical protein
MSLKSRPTLRSIVNLMTADELAGCAQDIIAWQDKGVLQEGSLRALAARFEAEAGIDEMSSLAQAEAAVLREVAVRFLATRADVNPA